MKNRNAVIAIILCTAFLSTSVAAEPWRIDVNANLALALNTYSDSWVGGDAGSFTWASRFLGIAEKQLTPRFNSRATIKLQFGQTKIQDDATDRWGAPIKSSDLIDVEELLRFSSEAWVEPFLSVRLLSQFLDGSDESLNRYLNPLEITEALGASKTLKKSATIDWSNRLGLAVRQTINREEFDPVLGERETEVTNDGGVEYIMDLKVSNRDEWISLLSSLRLYEALVSSKADETRGTVAEDYWRYPHMRWENTLTLTFAKYLMLNVTAYAYYDRNISSRVRLKETFSAGLTYLYSRK